MKAKNIVNLVLVVMAVALMAGHAQALVMHYDFNNTETDWALNTTGEGVDTNLQPQGTASKVASGAPIANAGMAANLVANGGQFSSITGAGTNHYATDGADGTIGAWINLNDGDVAANYITVDFSDGWLWGRVFQVAGGYLMINDYDDVGGWKENKSTVAAFGDGVTGWHHVAATWDQDGLTKFYLDGAQLGDSITANIWNTTLYVNWMSLGGHWWGGGFDGQMDEVYINYGEAKDAAFIATMVPEPGTMILLTLGGIAMIRSRK